MPESAELQTTLPPGAFTQAIREHVEREIAAVVPPDKRVVIVAAYDQTRTFKFGVAVRAGDGFKLAGDFSKQVGGPTAYSLKAVWEI